MNGKTKTIGKAIGSVAILTATQPPGVGLASATSGPTETVPAPNTESLTSPDDRGLVAIVDLPGPAFIVAGSGDLPLEEMLDAAKEISPELVAEISTAQASSSSRKAGEIMKSREVASYEEAQNYSSRSADGARHTELTPLAAMMSPVPPQVGYATNNERSWFIHRWITGHTCDNKGCTQTDRLDMNITVNPGAVTSMLSYNVTGVGPNMSNRRTGALVNYYGNDYGSTYDNLGSGLGSGRLWVTAGSPQNRNPIRHYVTLQATLSSPGARTTFVEHRGRTGWAICNAADNVCEY